MARPTCATPCWFLLVHLLKGGGTTVAREATTARSGMLECHQGGHPEANASKNCDSQHVNDIASAARASNASSTVFLSDLRAAIRFSIVD